MLVHVLAAAAGISPLIARTIRPDFKIELRRNLYGNGHFLYDLLSG